MINLVFLEYAIIGFPEIDVDILPPLLDFIMFCVLNSLAEALINGDWRPSYGGLWGGPPTTTYVTRRGVSSARVPIFGLGVNHHLSPLPPSCPSTPA